MASEPQTTVGEWTGDDIVSQLRSEGIDVHWGGRDGLFHRAADEIERLRALVTRLTDVAQDLASGLSDPGSEAMAAIHCGRHFIYG